MRFLGKIGELDSWFDEEFDPQMEAMLDAAFDRLSRRVARVLARHGVQAHESLKPAPAQAEQPPEVFTST